MPLRCNMIKAIIHGSVDSFYNETWKKQLDITEPQGHCDKKASMKTTWGQAAIVTSQ